MHSTLESMHFDTPDESVNRFLAGIVALLLITSFVDLGNYLSAIDPDFQPKRIYMACAALALLPIWLTDRRPESGVRLAFVTCLFLYSCLNLLHAWALHWPTDSNGHDIALFRAQLPPIAVVIALAATTLPRVLLAKIFGVILIIICTSVLVDFIFPQWLYPPGAPAAVPGRAAGLLVNPTKAGEAIVLSLLLALPALTPRRGLVLVLLAGLAILLTFSRGAILIWIVLFSLLWLIGTLPVGTAIVVAGAVALLTASIGLLTLYISQRSAGVNVAELIQRLDFFAGDAATDSSAATRMQVFLEGLGLFAAQPIFGNGAGASLEWRFDVGPHNQAVMMSADYGVVGLMTWSALGILCWTGGYYRDFRLQWLASGVFVLFSTLTHNMLDFTYWMVGLFLLSNHPRGAKSGQQLRQ